MLQKIRFNHLVVLIIAFGIGNVLFEACSEQTSIFPKPFGGLQVWLDQPSPKDETILPLAAYTLKAHAIGKVRQITFFVNSIPMSSIFTNANQESVSVEWHWNPRETGEYKIQAQAKDGGVSVLSEIAHVCIASETKTANACAVLPSEEIKITDTPAAVSKAITRTATEEQSITFDFDSSPDMVYSGQCSNNESQIAYFKGSASNMSKTSKVYLRIFLNDINDVQQELSTVPMTPSGDNNFIAEYDLRKMDPILLGGSSGNLIVSMALMDKQETFYASSPQRSIVILPCARHTSQTLELKVSASPDPVFAGLCTNEENQTVEFHGYVSQPNQGDTVNLRMSLVNSFGQHQELPPQEMALSSINAYITTYDMNKADTKLLAQEKGNLIFSMDLMDAEKKVIATSQEQSITVEPCKEKIANQKQQPQATGTSQSRDSLPPEIKTYISTNEIFFDPTGFTCDPNKPTSVTISAAIKGINGVKTPTLYWYYAKAGGTYGARQVVMYKDEYTWSSTIRADHGDDSVAYWIEVYDIYGNLAKINGEKTITVKACKDE